MPPTRPLTPDSVMDRLRLYSKPLAVVVGLALVGGAGYWLWQNDRQTKATLAEREYFQAQAAAASGNAALASSDLQKVVQRYPGTPAAVQASMLIAQIRYDEGKHAEGIAELERARASAPEHLLPGIHALLAAGHEDQGKHDLAAAEYRKAAEATPYAGDREKYLADAARALMTAGKTAEAAAIWRELADDIAGPTAGEARVRLGEIEAKPASRS